MTSRASARPSEARDPLWSENVSAAGARTRVARAKAEDPDQLYHSGSRAFEGRANARLVARCHKIDFRVSDQDFPAAGAKSPFERQPRMPTSQIRVAMRSDQTK